MRRSICTPVSTIITRIHLEGTPVSSESVGAINPCGTPAAEAASAAEPKIMNWDLVQFLGVDP